VPSSEPDYTPLLIGRSIPALSGVSLCRFASTLTAWSQSLNCEIIVAVTCKQWTCRFCGEQKAKKLAATASTAKPNKLITLTVRPSLHETPRHAFDTTAPCVSRLITRIRRVHGTCEYVRILETTKIGWPHYHLVARSVFIPQSWLSDEWNKLTGAPIVDLRAIQQTREVYWYVMKYLGKQRHCPWTDRRVTMSRGFVPRGPPTKFNSLDLVDVQREACRPEHFMHWKYQGKELTRLGTLVWAVQPTQQKETET